MQNSLLGLAVLAMATLLAACITQPEQPNLDGKDVKVVFMHTSDIHSRIVPYKMDVMMTDENLGLLPANAPFGGITRLASVIKQERRDNPRMAYIESGDVFQGAPIFNTFHGEPEFKAMSQLRVDAFAIGNHEFDNGATALVGKALTFAAFPMLGANYALGHHGFPGKVPTSEITEPYTIINLQGLRVGVIGMAAIGGGSSGGGAKGVRRLRDAEVVQSWVDFLRPIVDVVALTSHVGYHEDLEYIPRTEGLDIVFGGHLHIALDPPNVIQDCDITKLKREIDRYRCDTSEKLKQAQAACEVRVGCSKLTGDAQSKCKRDCILEAASDCKQLSGEARFAERITELKRDIAFLEKRGCHPRDVLLVHSGAFLKYVGRLETTFRQCRSLRQTQICSERDANDRCIRKQPRRCVGNQQATNDWEVISHKYKLIPIDKKLPEDPQMVQLMEPYILKLNQDQLLGRVIGYSPTRLMRFNRGGADSQLGNMVCDSMMERNKVWADFSLTNSLGMRTDLLAGPVDQEQMNNVFPFENSITVMHLSGYEVQALMDFAAHKSATRGCKTQAQVAGITATLNCKGCPGNGGNRCALSSYAGGPCAQKVTIGGSGRPCTTDKECEVDSSGKPTGEVCSNQAHPAGGGKKRCWRKISCSTVYRLATNDYVARGGSGFAVLAKNTTQLDLKIPLRDVANDHIMNMPPCSQVPQTFAEKKANKAPSYIVGQNERELLKKLEEQALAGKITEANAAYNAYVTTLKARQAKATGAEKVAFNSYMMCIKDRPDDKEDIINKRTCLDGAAGQGLTCKRLLACVTYNFKDREKCKSLAHIQSALRCMAIPCIQSTEDGRIYMERPDASSSPHWDDPTVPG